MIAIRARSLAFVVFKQIPPPLPPPRRERLTGAPLYTDDVAAFPPRPIVETGEARDIQEVTG